jgi:threonine/homoserine/homoserine lactone efflux protein
VKLVAGAAGGLLLVALGLMIFLTFRKPVIGSAAFPYNPLLTGIVMTGGNPYFFLWWATVGVFLITSAVAFGILGVLLFTVVHWACDIGWSQVVSTVVFKTRHLWTPRIQRVVFGVCAAIMIGFGVWFGLSAFI